MLPQLQQIFRSIVKSLEVLYVIEGAKPCARILVFEDEIGRIANFLDENGLFAAISDFKVLKQSAQSKFYSDRSIKIPKNSAEKGHFIVYLSRDKKIPEKAKLLDGENSHKELGLLLGYPECCCDFFEKNFDEKNTDLTLKILENSSGYEFPFYNNIAARHFDAALISHFPHSFECKQSIELAKSNLKIIQQNSIQVAGIFARMLQSAVIYTMEEGVFLLRNYNNIGSEMRYADILATTKSKLYFLLSSSRRLKIIGKNNFIVDGTSINGRQYGVMVFG